jgi:ubiquinone/menaquinone biosynthesis C-methylase UbiE
MGLLAQFSHPKGFLGRLAGKWMAMENVDLNDWALSFLDLGPNHRVLELGFGPGAAMEKVARIAVNGFVAGIDLSDAMVKEARGRNEEAIREGRVRIERADVLQLPSYDEPFDRVYSVNSFTLWNDPEKALERVRQQMKPGAKIVVVMQPRGPQASERTARQFRRDILRCFREAGFSHIRTAWKKMKPVSAVCVYGRSSPEGIVTP